MPEYTCRLTIKGQVTVPAEVRRLLHLKPKDKVTFLVENETVRLLPATSVVARTAGMLKSKQPRLSAQAEEIAAEEGIAEEVSALAPQHLCAYDGCACRRQRQCPE